MATVMVPSGQTQTFLVGPGALSSLNLDVLMGGSATVTAGWLVGDPPASVGVEHLNAVGGSLLVCAGSHDGNIGTVWAGAGGNVTFNENWLTNFDNTGQSGVMGGSIVVPINVIGTGSWLIEGGGSIQFAGGSFIASSVAATQSVNDDNGTLIIASLPLFHAPVALGLHGVIDVNALVADSASYDPTAHLVDFVGGGKVIAALSVTPTAPGGTVKIADLGQGSWAITDPVAHGHAAPLHHGAIA